LRTRGKKFVIAAADESLSFQIGNAYLDDNKNTKGQIDYLWSHGVISDEVWANITTSCTFSSSDGNTCSDAMAAYDSGYISGYNIYAPVCIDKPSGNYYPSSYVRAFLSYFFLIKI
jgi:serine carboxypeptidase-like clade 2